MRPFIRFILTPLFGLTLLSSDVRAELTLPEIFSNNMALQAEVPLNFWGKALPNDTITVTFYNLKDVRVLEESTTANPQGTWSLTSDHPLPIGARGRIEVSTSSGDSLGFENVIAGDVWLASGQSNMEWPVKKSDGAEAAIQSAELPTIRIFTVEHSTADAPKTGIKTKAGWQEVSPENIGDFSAVAFYFGRNLQETLYRPIGLISSNWGGTRAEAWTPQTTIDALPAAQAYVHEYAEAAANEAQLREDYAAELAAWEAAGKKGRKPWNRAPYHPRHRPAALYNAMIAPLVPYTIKGAIWYQGEANWSNPEVYQTLFPAMISGWREAWAQGDFPFLYVELANFQRPQTQPVEGGWAEIRFAQQSALALPMVEVATAIDVGAANDVHPTDKRTVGTRLARAALAMTYDHPDGTLAPRVIDSRRVDHAVYVQVANIAEGLEARETGERIPFALSYADGSEHWADYKIEGDRIKIFHPKIAKHPTAAYYGWASNPAVGIYNSEGLPLQPFRIDLTEKKVATRL